MKLTVIAVGRPSRLLAGAIREYEDRAARYWSLDVVEIREERAGRGRTEEQVREGEAQRQIERVPPGSEIIALTRGGEEWSSTRLARHLEGLAVRASPGATFVIGGAFGLGRTVLERATRRLSLSPLTLPHELARLVLAEQLYRAGTIARGEPYHKATE
jgi:23S rRNA (pseudouridine1915-N3)-methyltransferase